jgi:hypothetical protein
MSQSSALAYLATALQVIAVLVGAPFVGPAWRERPEAASASPGGTCESCCVNNR